MGRHHHILVVDRDPAVLTQCRQVLEQAGFAVETSSTAVPPHRIQASAPVLMLFDLPTLLHDGPGYLQQLCQHYPDMLLMGMISKAARADSAAIVDQMAAAMRLGMRELISTPLSADEMLHAVTRLLQQQQTQRMQRYTEQLQWLHAVTAPALDNKRPQALYNLAVDMVATTLATYSVLLLVWHPHQEALHVAASSCPQVEIGMLIPLDISVAGWVARHRQPLLVTDSDDIPADLDYRPPSDDLISALAVPLLAGDELLGVLYVDRTAPDQPFTATEQALLVSLADQIAPALACFTESLAAYTVHRGLVEHTTDAVVLLDGSGQRILDVNSAAERMTGYSRRNLLDLKPSALFVGLEKLVAAPSDGQPPLLLQEFSCLPRNNAEAAPLLRTQNGRGVAVSVSLSRVPYHDQHLLLLIARDMSRCQQIAKQVVQSEKQAAVGRLVSGIAHEMNNPLQAIHNSLRLLTNPAPDGNGEKRQRYLVLAQEEVEHLISIVQRVLEIYRPSREGMRPIDLHDLLRSVLTTMEQQLQTSGIRLISELHPHLPLVYGISSHLKQVYMSLIRNAIQSMSDGGVLTIRSYITIDEPDTPGNSWASASALPAADASAPMARPVQVVIEVSDTGCGIPADELSKVFEPFYKTHSNGVGLGLAISHGIVEQHQGTLTVSSVVGQGTTFCVVLPAAT